MTKFKKRSGFLSTNCRTTTKWRLTTLKTSARISKLLSDKNDKIGTLGNAFVMEVSPSGYGRGLLILAPNGARGFESHHFRKVTHFLFWDLLHFHESLPPMYHKLHLSKVLPNVEDSSMSVLLGGRNTFRRTPKVQVVVLLVVAS